MLQIYHNSRCTKSRECIDFLEKKGQGYEVVKYLEAIPSFSELEEIIKKLGTKPIELIRQKEKIWTENFKGKILSDREIIQAMIAYPILIVRPIVINGDKAVIARPVEKIVVIL
jgi:arsenate reductase